MYFDHSPLLQLPLDSINQFKDDFSSWIYNPVFDIEPTAFDAAYRICIVQFAAVMTVGERIPVLQHGFIALARVPAA
jgi:hypothetical protein